MRARKQILLQQIGARVLALEQREHARTATMSGLRVD